MPHLDPTASVADSAVVNSDVSVGPGSPTGVSLQQAILDLLEERAPSTICPSDVARLVGTNDGWRELMQPVRDAAARLADGGEVEVTQRGEVVDVRTATGPVRIRRPDGS